MNFQCCFQCPSFVVERSFQICENLVCSSYWPKHQKFFRPYCKMGKKLGVGDSTFFLLLPDPKSVGVITVHFGTLNGHEIDDLFFEIIAKYSRFLKK